MSKIKIAIADDHAMFLSGIIPIINGFGNYEVVIAAEHGQQLLELLHQAPALPGVCIIDIKMPFMDGYDTLKAIKKRYPLMKVLVLSMFDNEFSILKMLGAGANGYTFKEYDPCKLLEALDEVMEGNIYHPGLLGHRKFMKEHYNDARVDAKITAKEMEFLPYVCTELVAKEIAVKMGVKTRTVQSYFESLYAKLNIKTRTGLAVFAMSAGLVTAR